MNKRILFLGIGFACLMSALAVRLAFIQVVGHEDLAEAAARQQRIRIEGADSRGVIYDRYGQALTGSNREYVYIINKKNADEKVLDMLEAMGGRKLSNYNDKYYVYTVANYDKEATLALQAKCNAYVMEAERRYDSQQTAVHLIGYVNPKDAKGVSGIELMFDDRLSERNKNLYALADAAGNLLAGSGLYKASAEGETDSGVTTTLDGQLQKKVEEILNDSQYNGAVVVLETKTGEILASASTPAFNPNAIKDYMNSDDHELINKATQGEYPPGSIFKIIVAAAALEYGVPDSTGKRITLKTEFTCKGYQELHGIRIGCSTGGEEGHGTITLKDAFADSCNSAFIQLGQLTGGEKILSMASRMGLGKKPASDILGVREGNLTDLADTEWAGIGNLSIGQGQLLTTPLQIARMTNIIANDGRDVGVSLMKENQKYKEKGRSADAAQSGVRAISRETAKKLKIMMEAVMEYGTGNNIKADVKSAGKTGSAEIAQGEGKLVHGWFTGYFPADEPAYTVAVFMESGKSGRASAVPVFDEICQVISKR